MRWPSHAPAGRIAYVNGRYLPHALACVHVEDRGLQFGDSIYEVVGCVHGMLRDEDEHLDRLERSLREVRMDMPVPRAALKFILREVVRRNRITNGLLYLQVTRGAFRRDHPIPAGKQKPTLIVTAKEIPGNLAETRRAKGVTVITRPDERWARCDIKTTQLLPNLLAKTDARAEGAFEAWLVDRDGYVTEGASTTAWIVTREGEIVTRDLSQAILPGVTRRVILEAASQAQLKVIERKFTPAEAKRAKEAFLSAATAAAVPIVAIDGVRIGNGQLGPITQRVQEVYETWSAGRTKKADNLD